MNICAFIYQPTRHPAGAASTTKISRFYIPGIFSSFELDLMFVEDVGPAAVVLVGVSLSPPHPLMLPRAR